jgi:hypothetical protein
MSLTEKFMECCRYIKNKVLWIILIPAFLDTANLLGWEKMFHTSYNPIQKIFMIKLGIIGAPPSISFLFEDFPSLLFKYDSNGYSGIVTRFSLYNAVLLVTIIMITSFINSFYMGMISTGSLEKPGLKNVLLKANRLWHKFFLMNLITTIPIILMAFSRSFIFLYFIFIIFIYVQYSFAADDVTLMENFRRGISFLFNNLGVTIKMALVTGLAFTIFSLIAFPLLKLGNAGVIIDILICAYLGAASNRMVFEVYTASNNETS